LPGSPEEERMKRVFLLSLGTLALLLVLSGVALAATPQDIYNDFAADGDLDGSYPAAELQAYLNDATVHQYGDQAVLAALDSRVNDILAGRTSRGTFPFTGFEILIAGLGGLALLGGGLAIRRTAK
jgi:hypothetical protein